MSVEDVFKKALSTFKTRNTEYGQTWDKVGLITNILYPEGICLTTATDFAKFHILQWLIGKLVRYVNTSELDHIHDAGVYCFILESIHAEGICDFPESSRKID